MSETTPVSLSKAQEIIGFEGDREGRTLLRALEDVERAKGVVLVQRRKRRRRTHYRVTVAAIRLHAPELIPPEGTATLLRQAREFLAEHDRRVAELVDERCEQHFERRVMPVVQRLEREQRETARTVLDLSKSMCRGVGAKVSA